MKLDAEKCERFPGKIFHIHKEETIDYLDYKGLKLGLESPIHLTGQAFFKRGAIYLSAQISAKVRRKCSRCSKDILVKVTRRDDIEFKKNEEDGERLSAERFVYGYRGKEIEILALLASLIVSSLKPKPLCKPDCAGICPRCGVDLNEGECRCEEEKEVDPRLEKLKELL